MRRQYFRSGIVVALIGFIFLIAGQVYSGTTVCTYPTIQYSTTTLPSGVVSTTTILPPPCAADVPHVGLSYFGLAVFMFGLILVGLSLLPPKRIESIALHGSLGSLLYQVGRGRARKPLF